jgi:hypothetical protein
MSEYEETDAIEAVARALAAHSWELGGNDHSLEPFVERRWRHYSGQAIAAIDAYESWVQGPALTAEEVAKITQAVHDTIGSPTVIAKVEDGNALLQALRRRDLP